MKLLRTGFRLVWFGTLIGLAWSGLIYPPWVLWVFFVILVALPCFLLSEIRIRLSYGWWMMDAVQSSKRLIWSHRGEHLSYI